jgi:hypothetical protein
VNCTPWDTKTGVPASSNAGQRSCIDTANCTPTEAATLPALDLNYFECNVEPILDKFCAQLGCHGTEQGRALRVYARARLREASGMFSSGTCASMGTMTGTECIGANGCPCDGGHTPKEWQRNYDAARGFALDSNGNAQPAAQSELLTEPTAGGLPHAGVKFFKVGDANYTTILNWLSGSTLTTCSVGNN